MLVSVNVKASFHYPYFVLVLTKVFLAKSFCFCSLDQLVLWWSHRTDVFDAWMCTARVPVSDGHAHYPIITMVDIVYLKNQCVITWAYCLSFPVFFVYRRYWPLFLLFFYILAPIPYCISRRVVDETDSASNACKELALFLTTGIVVSAFGLPIVFARAEVVGLFYWRHMKIMFCVNCSVVIEKPDILCIFLAGICSL